MTTRLVIDPTALTITEDTLIRSEDGILTFAKAGSVGADCAFKSREAAEVMLKQMIAERAEEAAIEARTAEMNSSFRAAFRDFRTSKGL